MKQFLLSAVVALSLGAAFAPGQANAEGCLKGAAVGGVAGHLAGHHAMLGAGAGCAIGHHEASKHERENREQAQRNTPRDDDNR